MKRKILLLIIILATFLLVAPDVLAAGQPCEPGRTDTSLCNPLLGGIGKPANDFRTLALKFIFILGGFATLIPIIAITVSGFFMITSQGNEEGVTRAKRSLTWTVYGFVLAILSYLLVAGMVEFLGAGNIPNPGSPGLVNPLVVENHDFVLFVKGMLTRFLAVVGVIAVLILIFSGFRYITAGGNEEQAKQGKQGIQWTAAGILTILLSYVIIRSAASLFE